MRHSKGTAGCKKKATPPTVRPPKSRVSTPPSRDPERVPVGRLALWAVLAAVVLAGLYLYFRHQAKITPLLG